ncbi:MAG TPA: DUF3617 domain-containing protein [Thermoanaerobaculia bacterium]|nr:DUF3617 domain-containing protein [Thermoanaerobaculia bacterium]
MTFRKIAIALALCALPMVASAASPAKPGKWEMTMQMEMTGMPMKMPAHTVTYCLTKEEAENPEKLVPEAKKNSDCKPTDLKIDGNTVSWKVECEKSKMTGEGKVTYSGDGFDGGMHMTMPNGGEMNAKYSGKYLGPTCDK